MIGRSQCRKVALAVLCAAAAGCTAQQKSGESPETPSPARAIVPIPADLQNAVRDAELWGKALYDRYTSTATSDGAAVQTALETVRKPVNDSCAASYRAVAVVPPPGAPNDRIVVYYIGEVPETQGLMVGRHYRVETKPDGKGVLLGEPSTSRCLIVPPPPPGSTAPRLVTHLLSPAPNEYHVFLSRLDAHALEVVTETGHWLVDQGRISYLGRT
jgi:hypothetical protein